MRKLSFAFALLLNTAFAQSATHSVVLTLTDTANPPGTLYTFYCAAGPCAAGSAFTKIANALNAKTYSDTTVTGGSTYCYYATAVNGNNESAPSPMVTANVPTLFAPSTIVVVIQ